MNAAVAATLAYYHDQAQAYFAETAHLDNSALLARFLGLIAADAGKTVADIGCGSGRDLKAMRDQGYEAIGIEPAHNLAAMAREHASAMVIAKTLSEVDEIEDGSLAGAWACSSLLHIPAAELPTAFARINAWLKPGGVFYTCFKDGEGESTDPRGRTFTNLTKQELVRLAQHAGFEVIDAYQTNSIVPGRIQIWNNVFLRRPNSN